MIVLKSPGEVAKLREANKVVAGVLQVIAIAIRPGVETRELERLATEYVVSHGAKPAFPTVPGYRHTLCVSINEEVVHGIPGERRLKEGDVVSVDCGVIMDGFFGDHAWSYPVGRVGAEAERLLAAGERALAFAIAKCRVGNRLYDVSAEIEAAAVAQGFSVVKDYVGHGIGKKLHEDPQVPNFGKAGTGIKLRRGLVLALEPMINAGTSDVETLSDGWTVVTKDRKLSVHFEHTVAITDDGPDILSRI